MVKNISILGSTGSIGTQTLEVVRYNKDIKVTALAAGSNVDLIEKQIREFKPEIACLWSEEKAKELKERVKDLDVKILSGMEGLIAVATEPKARDRSYRSSGNDRYPAYHRCHGSRKRHCSGK